MSEIGSYLADGVGVKDLYPSERKACQGIMYALQLKHSYRAVTGVGAEDQIKQAFENECRNRFAEIGLVVGEIQWTWVDDRDETIRSPNVSDDPDDMNLYWYPRPVIVARTDKLIEVDHDRMAHEIRAGMLDGKEGVIDPNKPGEGLKEPKRKTIY